MLQFQTSEATAARRRVPIHLVDATDGITPETGEATGQPQLSKNGAAFGNTSATLTAIANGAYYVELTAGELDTLGFGVVRFKSANTAEAQVAFQVVAHDVYDSVRLGLTALPNAAAEAAGGLYTRGTGAGQINQNANGQVDTQTVAMATDVVTAGAIQANAIGASELATDAIGDAQIATGAIASTAFAAGAINAAAIATDAITADKIAAAAITSSEAPNLDAAISTRATPTEVATELTTIGLDHLVSAAVIGTDVTDNSIIARMVSSSATADWDSFANTTDALQAIRDKSTDIETDTADIQSRIPAALVGGAIDADVSAIQAGAVDAAAIATDAIDADAIAANAIGASELATDAIGDAQIATGAIASTAFAAGAIDAAAIANSAIDAATFAAGAIDATAIATAAIDADALATDTITAAKIAAGAITSSEAPNLDAAISTRATPAQVNTEVSDVLKTDTITLPGQAAPTATPTMEEVLAWLYKTFRNKREQTATTWSLYDDAGSTVDSKATVSDDGTTATKAEIVSGP